MGFIGSISPVGWLVVPVPALAHWVGMKSRTGASNLEEDIKGRLAGSSSYTPPPGIQARHVT